MKKVNVLIITVFIFISSAMAIQFNNLIKENKNLKETNNVLYQDNIKLYQQNEALWDNYYMNVSEYDGEYYE